MTLKSYQEDFANKNMQFIILDGTGVMVESDQNLFKVDLRKSVITLHPFFESIPALFESEDKEFNFYCVNFNVNDESFISDIKLVKKETGYLLIIYDLTEHYNSYQTITQSRNESVIKTELTVLKNLELQERERFKNRFIQNFSHELRNPLTSIMAIIEILGDTNMTDEQSKMLQFLKDSNSNLRLMLEDTLSIGMIDAGKLEIQNKLFGLRKFFELIKFTYAAKAKNKGLKFNCSWDDKIPEFVEGDRLRLYQIVTNLLDNALKYSEKGEITFDIQFNQKRANLVNLRFQVSDTGVGIPEESRETIFESFHREQSLKKRKGAGLGLTIVKSLLELMESKIQLNSELGKGSTFYFDLTLKYPLFPEDATSEEKDAIGLQSKTNQIEKPKYKILLVEDDEYVQTTLFKILLNTNRFCGIQITKLIRDFPFKNIKSIPIIGITANAYQENIDECLSVGMQKVIIKPFEKEVLLKEIHKILK